MENQTLKLIKRINTVSIIITSFMFLSTIINLLFYYDKIGIIYYNIVFLVMIGLIIFSTILNVNFKKMPDKRLSKEEAEKRMTVTTGKKIYAAIRINYFFFVSNFNNHSCYWKIKIKIVVTLTAIFFIVKYYLNQP